MEAQKNETQNQQQQQNINPTQFTGECVYIFFLVSLLRSQSIILQTISDLQQKTRTAVAAAPTTVTENNKQEMSHKRVKLQIQHNGK